MESISLPISSSSFSLLSPSSSAKMLPSVAHLFFFNNHSINDKNILQAGPITMILGYFKMRKEGFAFYQVNRLCRRIISSYQWRFYQLFGIETIDQYNQVFKWFPQSQSRGIYLRVGDREKAVDFFPILHRLSSLKKVVFGSQSITHEFLPSLCTNNNSIRYLNLSGNCLPFYLLRGLAFCPNLEYIDLSYTFDSGIKPFIHRTRHDANEILPHVSPPYSSFIPKLKSLKSIDLCHNKWVNGDVLSALTQCPLLEELDISVCESLTADDINQNISAMKSLTDLNLSKFFLTSNYGPISLFKVSEVIESICKVPSLLTINLSYHHFDNPLKIITSIINNPKISKLIKQRITIDPSAKSDLEKCYELLLSWNRFDVSWLFFGIREPLTVNCFKIIADSRKTIPVIDLSYDNHYFEHVPEIFTNEEPTVEVCKWIGAITGLEKISFHWELAISSTAMKFIFQCRSLRFITIRIDNINNDVMNELFECKKLAELTFISPHAYSSQAIHSPPAVTDDKWDQLLSLSSLRIIKLNELFIYRFPEDLPPEPLPTSLDRFQFPLLPLSKNIMSYSQLEKLQLLASRRASVPKIIIEKLNFHA